MIKCKRNNLEKWAVLVAQLVERSLLTPEVRSSDRQTLYYLYTVNCIEKTEIKEKDAGNGQLKNYLGKSFRTNALMPLLTSATSRPETWRRSNSSSRFPHHRPLRTSRQTSRWAGWRADRKRTWRNCWASWWWTSESWTPTSTRSGRPM